MSLKVLAFSGSSRAESFNRKLLEIAAHGARDAGVEVDVIRLADFELPFYDGDLEAAQGLPASALRLQQMVREHDALLIASPEYNGGYTALLKNTLDWISRPQPDGRSGVALFSGKVAAVISASPGNLGGVRSQIGIRTVLERLGLLVIPESFALAAAHQAFDGDGRPKDANVERLVRAVGTALARTAMRLESTG